MNSVGERRRARRGAAAPAGALGNAAIAQKLEQVAELLEQQEANPFRVQAYRHAAEVVRGLPRPAADLARDEGLDGFDRLPGIGMGLARTIRELALTGRLALLDRLRGESDPEALLATVPGVGPHLARRLHDELGVESLEELEAAAMDGRLRALDGFGDKRVAAIRDALATRLGRGAPRSHAGAARGPAMGPTMGPAGEPPVPELLDVDHEYRRSAAAGGLRTIAPRRFNPTHEAWLPVLHTQRGDRHYTALFSNTARAHELGRTRDWVVVYYTTPQGERQATVVTAAQGPLRGRRVVRGREEECLVYYGPDLLGT